MADPVSPPPPPIPPRSAGPRKLVRRPDDGMVAGVCAGVAEYFDLDPVIVRLGAVALLFSGIGFVLYPAAWIFVPAADGHTHVDISRRPGLRDRDRHRQVAAVALIVIALCIIAGGWWWLPRHWLFPLGLIGAGAFLLARRDKDDHHPAPPPPAPPVPPYEAPRAAPGTWTGTAPTSVVPAPPAPAGTTEAPTPGTATTSAAGDGDGAVDGDDDDDAEGDPATSGDHDGTPPDATPPGAGPAGGTATAVGDAPVGDPTSVLATDAGGASGGEPPTDDPFRARELPFPPVPPDVPDVPRHHRRRGRFVSPLVFGALLIWGGAAWLGGVELPTALAIGLVILGSGFVLGAFVGGSKALIAPALVIGGLLIVASIADIPWDSGIGERHWQPQDVSHLHRSYELAIGEGTLDLSDLDLTAGTTRHVNAKVGIGHLKVIVPDDVQLDITGHTGAGDVEILGKEDDGFQVDVDRTVAGTDGRGKLDLDLEVGLGDLEVVQAAS